jgi:hypothetical protein
MFTIALLSVDLPSQERLQLPPCQQSRGAATCISIQLPGGKLAPKSRRGPRLNTTGKAHCETAARDGARQEHSSPNITDLTGRANPPTTACVFAPPSPDRVPSNQNAGQTLETRR